MMHLFVGFIAEGKTDYRFLTPIINKTLSNIIHECNINLSYEVKEIRCTKGKNFPEYVKNASKKANDEYGITLLIIHADADDKTAEKTYSTKIIPARENIKTLNNEEYCKNIVALVPVYETEAWMLADKSLFIKTISSKKKESELNIKGLPEKFTDPKQRIKKAIETEKKKMPKKRREYLQIEDLYASIGAEISIENLRNLESYRNFEKELQNMFMELNLIQDIY